MKLVARKLVVIFLSFYLYKTVPGALRVSLYIYKYIYIYIILIRLRLT